MCMDVYRYYRACGCELYTALTQCDLGPLHRACVRTTGVVPKDGKCNYHRYVARIYRENHGGRDIADRRRPFRHGLWSDRRRFPRAMSLADLPAWRVWEEPTSDTERSGWEGRRRAARRRWRRGSRARRRWGMAFVHAPYSGSTTENFLTSEEHSSSDEVEPESSDTYDATPEGSSTEYDEPKADRGDEESPVAYTDDGDSSECDAGVGEDEDVPGSV